ncbi:predicted protein [Botrytis cinerea T4]|uniref:Uncharacterized protein n=1 Tax=Botryotinia fuckeliana (strain T4) TaxID=999810 RepID=G2XXQ7_BOTF4|nr:predicted protein [Botrytis cinerea T4]
MPSPNMASHSIFPKNDDRTTTCVLHKSLADLWDPVVIDRRCAHSSLLRKLIWPPVQ